MKTAVIILVITTLLGLGGAVFFFANNQTLTSLKITLEQQLSSAEQELVGLKDEKTKIETELAVLKNTDLAKEIELLQLKLKTTEKDLASAQSDVSRLTSRNNTLEDNAKKIKLYFKAVDLIQLGFFSTGRLEDKFPEIERAISAIGDKALSGKWQSVEQTIRADLADGSWSPALLGEMMGLLINRIENFLP